MTSVKAWQLQSKLRVSSPVSYDMISTIAAAEDKEFDAFTCGAERRLWESLWSVINVQLIPAKLNLNISQDFGCWKPYTASLCSIYHWKDSRCRGYRGQERRATDTMAGWILSQWYEFEQTPDTKWQEVSNPQSIAANIRHDWEIENNSNFYSFPSSSLLISLFPS